MPFNVGPMELTIVLVLALVILGPKRLPEAGKAVGKGMREFRQSISGRSSDEDDEPDAIPASAQTAQAQETHRLSGPDADHRPLVRA